MFKLLIVDDEFITRQGIMKQINFQTFNIHEVKEADDGVNALKIAKDFKPDIVISDIRMPRMDGITFAYELNKCLPKCRIIFMSAYTELDYYRNAIKLNAISYIEKPIDLEELEMAIKNAVDDLMQYIAYENMSQQVGELLQNNEEVLRNQVSTLLIERNPEINLIENKSTSLGLSLFKEGYFVTLLIKYYSKGALDPHDQDTSKTKVKTILEQYFQPLPTQEVWHFKGNIVILNIMVDKHHQSVLLTKLKDVCLDIYNALLAFCRPAISIGKVVHKLEDFHESYISSVVGAEKLFFQEKELIYSYESYKKEKIYEIDTKRLTEFKELLEKSQKVQSIIYIKNLTNDIRDCTDTPINNVKDIYFQLILILNQFIETANYQKDMQEDIAWSILSEMICLSDIEKYMLDKINQYYNTLEEQGNFNSITLRVKQYIQRNYDDPTLSIDSISSDLDVSSTYVCAVFKKEMGITINKFITKYRIDRAKELIRDPGLRIDTVAQSVGYLDSDYFSKVFKKQVLCTPTEYRKKFLI